MILRPVMAALAASVAAAAADFPAAAAYSAARGEKALVVLEKGRITCERGPALALTPRIFSMTKSLVCIGVFRDMVSGGLSLGQAVSRGPARGVRLADLMNQTSGLAPMSGQFYSTGLEDKDRVLAKLPRPERSRSFCYGASHWEVLAEEIRLVRGTPLESWLRKFVPGIDHGIVARWRHDDRGKIFFSTGARMSARQLLPAAREVLVGMGRGRGRWPGAVRDLLCSGTRQNPMYALGFWLNLAAGRPGAREVDVEDSLDPPPEAAFWREGCLSHAAPRDLLAMIGSGGQRVYVVPSRELVIIRLADSSSFSDAEFLGRYFGAVSRKGSRG